MATPARTAASPGPRGHRADRLSLSVSADELKEGAGDYRRKDVFAFRPWALALTTLVRKTPR